MVRNSHLPQRPVAVLLDFDGVIVQSVHLKTNAFLQIYADEDPTKLAALLAYQRAHGGVTRRVKFRYFEERIFRRAADDARIEELSRRYTSLVHDAVLACPLVEGAAEFLSIVYGRTHLHVVSGTPAEELADIVLRRGLTPYFASVRGAPESKPEVFRNIVCRGRYAPGEVLAIGDATTECEAAAALGIPFLGIVPEGEMNPFPPAISIVPTLQGLAEGLGFCRL